MTEDELAENHCRDAAGLETRSGARWSARLWAWSHRCRSCQSSVSGLAAREGVNGCTKHQARAPVSGLRESSSRAYCGDRRARAPARAHSLVAYRTLTPPARGHASSAFDAKARHRIPSKQRPTAHKEHRRSLHPTSSKICGSRKTTPHMSCEETPAANSKHDKSGINIDDAAPRRIVHAGLVSTIQNDQARQGIIHPANEDPANKYTLVDVPPRRAEHRRPRPASSKMMPPRGSHPTPHVVRAELETPTPLVSLAPSSNSPPSTLELRTRRITRWIIMHSAQRAPRMPQPTSLSPDGTKRDERSEMDDIGGRENNAEKQEENNGEKKDTHISPKATRSPHCPPPGLLDPIPIRIPIPYHRPPHRRTSKLKTPDSAQVGPIAATRANAVVGQATPSTSTAAPASPAGTSRPVRSWAGVARRGDTWLVRRAEAWRRMLAGSPTVAVLRHMLLLWVRRYACGCGWGGTVARVGAGIGSGGDGILVDVDLGRRRRVFGAVAGTGRVGVGQRPKMSSQARGARAGRFCGPVDDPPKRRRRTQAAIYNNTGKLHRSTFTSTQRFSWLADSTRLFRCSGLIF
ncbi:hypothetical protein B0H13DRAFT_2272617 [Mycena leptocephala]|nr:hypothetical protein B0H13DRAFT_2272617 [Mycena leptocephala]